MDPLSELSVDYWDTHMVKSRAKRKQRIKYSAVLFAVMNKCRIWSHRIFYMVNVTFTGEGSVWAQNIE